MKEYIFERIPYILTSLTICCLFFLILNLADRAERFHDTILSCENGGGVMITIHKSSAKEEYVCVYDLKIKK